MRGFTLIELILVIAIFTVTVSIGIPSFKSMLENHHARVSLYTLRKILHQSRIFALENRTEVLVCPLSNSECSDNWSSPLTVFKDTNNNRTLDDNEKVFVVAQNPAKYGYWQKKKSKQRYIKFTHLGHAFGSATTFLYCPNSGYSSFAKQLVISFQGRIRTSSYLSNKGTPYASISPLSCTPR